MLDKIFIIIYSLKASDTESKINLKCGDTDEVRPSDFTRFSQSEKTFTTNYLFDLKNTSTISPLTGFIKNATHYNTHFNINLINNLKTINSNSNDHSIEAMEFSDKQNSLQSTQTTQSSLRTFLINKNVSTQIRDDELMTTKMIRFENSAKTSMYDLTKSSYILSTLMSTRMNSFLYFFCKIKALKIVFVAKKSEYLPLTTTITTTISTITTRKFLETKTYNLSKPILTVFETVLNRTTYKHPIIKFDETTSTTTTTMSATNETTTSTIPTTHKLKKFTRKYLNYNDA